MMGVQGARIVSRRIRLAGLVVLLITAVAPLPARQAAGGAPNRRIEGDWVRLDPDGSGSFGGLGSKIAPAVLTPEAMQAGARGRGAGRGGGGRAGAASAASDGRANDTGVPYVVVAQPCNPSGGRGGGALLLNPDSGGVHFVEEQGEVIFAGERGGVRHIYMDGRPHPNNWVPTGAGHSVGHYEGDVLVVDTVGMTAGTVVAGGRRSPETHLTERFEVSADGTRMTITYTWNDPKIYEKPHTYQYFMERMPAGSYAFEEWCDAGDPIEQQSIVPPAQLP